MSKKTAESVLNSARENNEPVFVLRAKDNCSRYAIRAYLDECRRVGSMVEHRDGVVDILTDFEDWQANNPRQVKKPD